jgi:8-oxo-dGTP pyrophosphatase MutT (NUDIX family)
MRDWTARELAEEAGLTDARIRQLLISGELEGRKRAGVWFISEEEAQRWLEERSASESENTETEPTD